MRALWTGWALCGGLSGCGWLSEAEVAAWLEGATCAGAADAENATGCIPHFVDADRDGFGGEDEACLCNPNDTHTVSVGGDCNDADPSVNPAAIEVCDADFVDEDCDPITINNEKLYYLDLDGDGYGTASSQLLCEPDAEFRALQTGDCDDSDPAVSADRPEICDGIDNDCNPETLETGLVTIVGGATFVGDLQAAVDEAEAGAVLSLCSGVWDGVEIWKSLRVEGFGEAGSVVVDGGGAGPAVQVSGGAVELAALTLTGGTGYAIGAGAVAGGGLMVSAGGTVAGEDLVITGNRVEGVGGGIYAAGSLRLEDSLVYDNSATADGGGIYIVGGPLELVDTNLFYNQATRGAGIYLLDSHLLLDRSRISGNFGDTGGGLYVEGASVVTGRGATGGISSNSATVLGAGVAITAPDAVVELVNVSLSDNVTPEWGGGAAIIRGSLVSTGSHWVGTEVADCRVSNYPGDVYAGGSSWCAGDAANFACTTSGCEGAVSTDCSCPGL